jgi:hypothetical protein
MAGLNRLRWWWPLSQSLTTRDDERPQQRSVTAGMLEGLTLLGCSAFLCALCQHPLEGAWQGCTGLSCGAPRTVKLVFYCVC